MWSEPESTAFHRGTVFEVPSKQCPDFAAAVDIAQDGDCIRLEPMTYEITTPVFLTKSLYILGFNEIGEYAVLHMNTDFPKPNMPMLRVDAEKCHIKGVKFRFSHNKDKAVLDSLQKTYAIFIARGSVVFDDVTIESSCGGVRNANHTYLSLISCIFFECETTGAMIEGKCFFDRCVFKNCGRGIAAVLDVCDGEVKVRVGGCSFASCEEGVSIVGHTFAHVIRNTFRDVGVGVVVHTTSLPSAQPSIIRSNEIRNPRQTGIMLLGEGCTTEVSRNLIHLVSIDKKLDTSTSSVKLGAACGVKILEGMYLLKANVIRGWAGAGIQCIGGNPVIESNIIEDCGVGVYIRCARPVIRSNVLSGHSSYGIIVEPTELEYNHMVSETLHEYDVTKSSSRKTSIDAKKDPISEGSKSISPARSANDSETVHEYIQDMPEADPLIDNNDFSENHINIRITNMTSMITNNKLGISVADNIVLDGHQNIAIAVCDNVIKGSRQGACVLLLNGVEARIKGNDMEGSKLAAICMETSGYCEIRENVVKGGCQGAVTANHRAVGNITENKFGADMPVVVFMDSEETVTVSDNYII